jgi:hypothetical protein
MTMNVLPVPMTVPMTAAVAAIRHRRRRQNQRARRYQCRYEHPAHPDLLSVGLMKAMRHRMLFDAGQVLPLRVFLQQFVSAAPAAIPAYKLLAGGRPTR